jgi:bifunctional ADP-heptose synthase (sugar kinase/adenylyltransferase)
MFVLNIIIYLLRVDENDTCEKIDIVSFKMEYYDAVIISDYCKGFLMKKI